MNQLSTLLLHARNYSMASLLTMVAGLVSFPILTRVLSVEDYGLMSLVASSLTLAVGLGKLGMQHAVLRFHGQVVAGNMPGVDAASLLPTAMYGTAGLAGLVLVAWLGAALLLPAGLWSDARLPGLMLLASVLVFTRVLDSACNSVMRARQHSAMMARVLVLRRYTVLACVLGAVLLIAPTVHHAYGAIVLAEVSVCALTLWILLRREPMAPSRVNLSLFKTMVMFAAPMTAYELSDALEQIGSRYVLSSVLGAQQVGLYSAAANLCEYVYDLVFLSLVSATVPMCLQMAEKDGLPAVQAFVGRFTHRYVLLTCGVSALVVAVSYDVLALVASEKYHDGAAVIPWVMFSLAFKAFAEIAALGLFLAHRTVTTMLLLYGCALLNVVLNALCVPVLGLPGVGIAGAAADLTLLILAFYCGRRWLAPPPFTAPLLKFGLCGALACLAVWQIETGLHLLNLVARSAGVLALFGVLAATIDATARAFLREGWLRIRNRFGTTAAS